MSAPLVSVVMPLYNKGLSVRLAIASVLSQTEDDFELVVVNDGSSDDSEQVVLSIKDTRIRLITQINGGESAARNRGIKEAKADLIAFLDADDEWMPHFLGTVLELARKYPQAAAFASAFFACKEGVVIRYPYIGVRFCIGGEIVENYFRSCTLGSSLMCSSAILVRRFVFDQVGDFPLGVKNGADLHMWTRIALRYPIAWSPIENAIWHLSAENRCAGMVVMNDTPIAGLLANAESDGTFPPDTIFWLREYVSRLRLHLAGVARNNGNIEVARQLLWMARTTKIFSKQWRLLAIQLYTPGILLQTRRFLMSFLRSERSHCPYARHS